MQSSVPRSPSQRLFAVDLGTMKDLRAKTINALAWSFIDKVAGQICQFVIGIILARLIEPAEFGLIAMLSIFMSIAGSFVDSGFGSALIQKQDATQTDYSTVFYFNLIAATAGACILWLGAPAIASFYNEPRLDIITKVLSCGLILASPGLVHAALVAKRLDFKRQAVINLGASVSSGTIGVICAFHDLGVWSLIVQAVSHSAIRCTLLWLFVRWRPSLLFSFRQLKEMFGFGSSLLASALLFKSVDGLYFVAIGKIFSARDLGFYSRARSLEQLPSGGVSSIVAQVTFPVFSTVQHDADRLKRGLKKALTTLVLLNFPMMIGLAITADSVVVLLLTERWLPCVPYLQLLCIVGLLYPLHVINLNALVAQGRSDLFFRLEILKAVLVLSNVTIGWRFGIQGLIWGQLLVSLLAYYVNSYYTGALIGYPIVEQIRDLFPYLVAAVAMGLAVYPLSWLPVESHLSLLFLQVSAGLVIYGTMCRTLKLAAFMELWRLAHAKIDEPRAV